MHQREQVAAQPAQVWGSDGDRRVRRDARRRPRCRRVRAPVVRPASPVGRRWRPAALRRADGVETGRGHDRNIRCRGAAESHRASGRDARCGWWHSRRHVPAVAAVGHARPQQLRDLLAGRAARLSRSPASSVGECGCGPSCPFLLVAAPSRCQWFPPQVDRCGTAVASSRSVYAGVVSIAVQVGLVELVHHRRNRSRSVTLAAALVILARRRSRRHPHRAALARSATLRGIRGPGGGRRGGRS